MPQPNEQTRRRSRRRGNRTRRNRPAQGRQLRNLEYAVERTQQDIDRLEEIIRMHRGNIPAQLQVHHNLVKLRRDQNIQLRQLAMMRNAGINTFTAFENASTLATAAYNSAAAGVALPLRNNTGTRTRPTNLNNVRRELF